MLRGLDDNQVIPDETTTWPEDRQLPAEIIRHLLLTPDLIADPRGLLIRGALITGALELSHVKSVIELTRERFRRLEAAHQSSS
ncbi:hypothetical protein [Cryobacterium sp. M91]|uniref:hypothetical protein n=1 Tax=Cryobacterium sp. M91 TaxID=2048294 RepID=UPI000CE44ECC|nr:hypothetical protein [Cryobacterium sp. M91]